MSRKIGYAVVGLGVGRSHCDAAYKSKNAKLVAVCDVLESKLEDARKKYEGVRTYLSFDEMMTDPEIDVVSVALPSGMHAEFAVKVMEAGKHVLVEKPIDVTVEKAMKIEEARIRTGRKAGVIFQNRFNPVMRPIKEAVDGGEIGRLLLGNFAVKWNRSQEYYDNGGWRGTWKMDGGGSLINQAIHTLDLMQWLMGDVHSVTSAIGIMNHKIETEDLTLSILKFKSGAMATFTSATCCYPTICTAVQLYGEKGSIEVDSDELRLWKVMDGDPAREKSLLETYGGGNKAVVLSDPDRPLGHAYMVEDMISAVLEDRDPAVGPLEAMKSVRIIESVYQSAKNGREVFL